MKEFDLVIFGATGLTGCQAATYVNQVARDEGIRWAIAGRNPKKLKNLVKMAGLEPDAIIVADALEDTSVSDMVKRTVAVINLAGPYVLYGSSVVKACAENGVSYADLSGETHFVRDMIDQYDKTAKKTGARIINVCGYEALPFDLGCLLVADRFETKYSEPPELIESVTQFKFKGKVLYPSDGLSGGTWLSAVEMLKSEGLAAVDDPHLLVDGDRSWLPEQSKTYDLIKSTLPRGKGWLAPMIPSPWLNPPIIYRSQEILREKSSARGYTYREGMNTSGYIPGDKLLKPFAAIGLAALMESGAWLVKSKSSLPKKWVSYVMEAMGPKSGDGPKPERLDLWSYSIDFIATRDDGRAETVTVTGMGQPGYKSTADIIGQVGILLATNDKRLPERSGVLTPATALGLDVLPDFEKARLTFS